MSREKTNEYISVYMPNHPRAFSNGCVYEHFIAAEKKLGRALKSEEVVHHIDFNKKNNEEINIMVFASKSDHTSFHDGGVVFIDNEGVAHCDKINLFCSCCGRKLKFKNKNGMCKDCYLSKKWEEKGYPSREKLKSLIREFHFVKIANIYGVSDNAVRKWCKKFELPFKSSEIRKICESEWELV